jgi:branched-chain amino acid transport system ATP-binding protein
LFFSHNAGKRNIIRPNADEYQGPKALVGESMTEEPVLDAKGLEKRFGGVRAVAGIDFRVHRGELRCLIGPNGAGKSTFFKLLTGQVRATSGRIVFDGRDITGLEPYAIGALGIGIKNQVPSVFDGLTVAENLWLAARHRYSAARAASVTHEILERLHLTAVVRQNVGTLAHGMRQWVDIGMVMIQHPKLVLLDEPTAGMAADEIGRMVEVIRDINGDASVIVVEHDMQFIRRLNSLVTVLHQGQILVEGAMDEVQRDARVRQVYLGTSRHA